MHEQCLRIAAIERWVRFEPIQVEVPEDDLHLNCEPSAAVHRYYLRWEGSYSAAFRHIRALQTDRACIGYMNGKPPQALGPLTDLPKMEHFARRIAKQVTLDDVVRKELNNQHAILTLEKQIRDLGAVPITGKLYKEAAKA